MKRIYIVLGFALFWVFNFTIAQQPSTTNQKNIFETLANPDSLTNARVIVHQDQRIEQLIINKNNNTAVTSQNWYTGYRVQVFSSNVQKTAKAEAFNVERSIREVFPDEQVYVNYTSPFWKVRVGDFDTSDKAQAFRQELIEAFPEFQSSIYIVREQIQTSTTK